MTNELSALLRNLESMVRILDQSAQRIRADPSEQNPFARGTAAGLEIACRHVREIIAAHTPEEVPS